jgi:tripartite ATP-independent transporter DctM subunit
MVSIGSFLVAMTIMVTLLLGGLWIFFAVGIGGLLSLYPTIKEASFVIIGIVSWDTCTDFTLVALPLFIFMGEYIAGTGLVTKLYSGASKIISGLPGDLVQTNLFSCTIFAACSGSSLASAATMGRVAYPEQVLRRRYNANLVLGSIAGGGTLGILIPPSIFFIIYGSMADQSIGKLYIAGIFPGLMLYLFFMLYVGIRCVLNPSLVAKRTEAEKVTWKTRCSGFVEIWPVFLLIGFVLGSIYGGVATPTEAAGIGAFMAILIAIYWKVFTRKALFDACKSTLRTNCMIFMILIFAKVLAVAVGYYGIPSLMRDIAQGVESPVIVLLIISITYLLLGTIFDDFSLMLLMLPFVVPIVRGIGYDLIWFGVFMCILLQAGLLSPPIGMNLFVIQGMTEAPFMQVVWGSTPFFFILLLGAVVITIFPSIALWLPGL